MYDEEIFKKLNDYNRGNAQIAHTRVSDLALKNQYVFFKGFDNVKFFKKIDWNYKHKHTAATYQVYLHTLNIVRNLTNSFLKTNDERYINKAKNIINDWINSSDNHSFYAQNAAWKDHSVASRMKNIIYFQQNCPDKLKLDADMFEKLVSKHCEFLSRREFYAENNHGMMSDEALLFLSGYLKDSIQSETYSQKAILRMERMILKLFSSNSYNLENSPEYHRLTQKIARNFIKLIDIFNLEFDKRCRGIIAKSYERNKIILKPDQSYPLIGDTGFFEAKIEKSYKNFIDYQAGLAIINTKNETHKADSSYLTFKAGYLTQSHKHKDDLSITYFHRGEDILIDSGKYTYDRRNPKRSYIISPSAHSTIHKLNESYELGHVIDDVDNLKINFVFENDEYIQFGAINHLYKNSRIYRDVIYFEGKGLIIIDRSFSNEIQSMGQNFNLSSKLDVFKISSDEYHLVTHQGNRLVLKEHTEKVVSEYFTHKNAHRGFYSLKFNNLLETHQIEFRKNADKCYFVTTLLDEDEIIIEDIQLKNNKMFFNLDNDNYVINLQSIERL